MADAGWGSDEDLLGELRSAVAGRSEVHSKMYEAAKAAFTWRSVDTELKLLALSFDSLVDSGAAMRGPALTTPRMLIFEGEEICVGLEVGTDVLTGQLSPAQPGLVVLMTPDGWFGETEGDDAGFFLLARPGPGPMRLECHTEHAHLVTDWVSI